MRIVVTVKLVPDTSADKRIDPESKRLVRMGLPTVLNPFDEYAIEAALQLKEKLSDGSTVTIVSLTPESGKEIVRKALALGADRAVMLTDPAFAGPSAAIGEFADLLVVGDAHAIVTELTKHVREAQPVHA